MGVQQIRPASHASHADQATPSWLVGGRVILAGAPYTLTGGSYRVIGGSYCGIGA
jgi:hypothetical protein